MSMFLLFLAVAVYAFRFEICLACSAATKYAKKRREEFMAEIQ